VTGSIAIGGRVDDQSNVVSEEDELQRAIQVSMSPNPYLCSTVYLKARPFKSLIAFFLPL